MVTVILIDEEGFFVEPVSLEEGGEIPSNVILSDWGSKRLFKPKFDTQLGEWVEGLSPDELNLRLTEVEEQKGTHSKDELNALAIMELTEIVLGGV